MKVLLRRVVAVATPLVLLVAAVQGVGAGCSSSDRPEGSSSGTIPTEGPCQNGDTRICYGVLSESGGVKTCFSGQQRCDNGGWSACQGPKGGEVEIASITTNGRGLASASSQGDEDGHIHAATHLGPRPDAGCLNPCDPACNGWFDCARGDGGTNPDGGCPPGIGLDASTDASSINGFPGVPPGHVNKMAQDKNCFGPSYNHGCDHWPHDPGSGAPTEGFSACQGDMRCGGSGCCQQFAAGEVQPSGHCLGSAPDLTVGNGCTLGGVDYFPICNRGTAAVPAGSVIGIAIDSPAGNLPQATAYAAGDFNSNLTTPAPTLFVGCPNKTATCTLTLAAPLAPGACISHTCGSISGTKHIYINSKMPDGGAPGVTECDLDGDKLYSGSPVAPGCSNNWTVIGNPPACVVLFGPKVLTYAYTATCPVGTRPRWGKLAWNSVIPLTTNITFEVRTRGTQTDGGLSGWSPWVTAGDTPPDPAVCAMTGPAGCPKVFSSLLGPVAQYGEQLELRITMDPSPAGLLAPTLNSWMLNYTCVDAE